MEAKVRKRRVLVVEPDDDFNSMLVDFLEAQRFDVKTAHTGDDGFEAFKDFAPDIILLSRELPMEDGAIGPDGLRLLKSIKQNGDSRAPVILMSESATERDFDRYRKLKFTADDYIKKPFEDTEVLRRIENFVGFDLSEGVDHLKTNIKGIIGGEDLGVGASSATRLEVSKLLEQVGKELERQEDEFSDEEAEVQREAIEEEIEEESDAPASLEDENEELRAEIRELKRKMEALQKKLVSERKRSRDIKREWKSRLTEIESELSESEEREERIRDEVESMREKFADMELDHTMELERSNAERRRLQEELEAIRLKDEKRDKSEAKLLKNLKKVTQALDKIVAGVEEKSSSPLKKDPEEDESPEDD